ncbi:MAG: hypothetical protein QM760_05750 [Nibricoccus sp.]
MPRIVPITASGIAEVLRLVIKETQRLLVLRARLEHLVKITRDFSIVSSLDRRPVPTYGLTARPSSVEAWRRRA